MAVYTLGQIQSLMRSVGWPDSIIPLMAAVAMGESSGNTSAYNSRGEHSVGLFQINMDVHRNYSHQQLTNPVTNATEALRIYRLQGLRAWGAYTDGRYRRYLAESQRVYNQSPSALPAVVSAPSRVPIQSTVAAVGGTALTIGNWVWQNWFLVLAGFAVLALVASLI